MGLADDDVEALAFDIGVLSVALKHEAEAYEKAAPKKGGGWGRLMERLESKEIKDAE